MASDQLLLTEPPVLAVYQRLTGGALATELADLRTSDRGGEVAAGLLADPAHVYDFIPTPGFLVDFPTIGIGQTTSRLQDDTGSSATGHHLVTVVVFLAGVDQRALAWGLRRYMQAVARVVMAGRSLEDEVAGGGRTLLDGIQWGPTHEADEDPRTVMSYAGARVLVRREELP